MKKNKALLNLSIYFGISLLAFAIVMCSTFIMLFRKHTFNIYKKSATEHAESIANTLSNFMGKNKENVNGFGAYLRFVGDLAGSDVWIIDDKLELVTSGMGKNNGLPQDHILYENLPNNAYEIIDDVFEDKIVYSEDKSNFFLKSSLTVGVPIKDDLGKVIGVVLLYSPIEGTYATLKSVITILIIGILAGLVISLLLSIWLSKNYTDPITRKEALDALKMEKMRQDFVANISHELKTPITVIRGSLEALLDKVVIDSEMVESYHHQMLQETIFLQRLVGDLLDLSKLQNIDFAIEKQEISLMDLIDETIRSAEQLAIKKSINLMLTVDKDTIIYGDYGRLRQMLLIVLDNAIKFSNVNGIIEVHVKKSYISIKDYGLGINSDDIPHIFERFYKTTTNSNRTGTGLGLPIAKQIADRHCIKISVCSEADNFTVFSFLF